MNCGIATTMGLVAWALTAAGHGQSPATAITLKNVDYAGLKQAVQQHKGKVLLVDFWGEY